MPGDEDCEADPEDNDPEGDAKRVLRGGSWYYYMHRVRCEDRTPVDHLPEVLLVDRKIFGPLLKIGIPRRPAHSRVRKQPSDITVAPLCDPPWPGPPINADDHVSREYDQELLNALALARCHRSAFSHLKMTMRQKPLRLFVRNLH